MHSPSELEISKIDEDLASLVKRLVTRTGGEENMIGEFETFRNRVKNISQTAYQNPRLTLCDNILRELRIQDFNFNNQQVDNAKESRLRDELKKINHELITLQLANSERSSGPKGNAVSGKANDPSISKTFDRKKYIITELAALRDKKSLFDRLRWVVKEQALDPQSLLAPSVLIDGIKNKIEQLCWIDGMEASKIYTKNAIHQLVYPPVVPSPVQYNNNNSGMQLPNFNSNGVSSSRNGSELGISSNAVVVDPVLAVLEKMFSRDPKVNAQQMNSYCKEFLGACVQYGHYTQDEADLALLRLKTSGLDKFNALNAAISSFDGSDSTVVKKAHNEFLHLLFPYDGVAAKDKGKRDAFLQKNKVFLEQIKLKAKEIGGRYGVGSEVNNNNTSYSSLHASSQPTASNSSTNPTSTDELSKYMIMMINANNQHEFKSAKSSLLHLYEQDGRLSEQELTTFDSELQRSKVKSLLKKGTVEELVSLFTPDTKDMPTKVREQIIQTVSEHKSNAQKNDFSADPFTNSQSSSKQNVSGSFAITPPVSSPISSQVDEILFSSPTPGVNVSTNETYSNTTASSSAATNLAQPSATDFKGKVINLVVHFITSNESVETLTSKLENLKNEVTATNAKPAKKIILLDLGDEESSDSQKTLSESDEKLYKSILGNQLRIENIRRVVNQSGLTKPEVIKNAKEIAALLFYPKDTSATTPLQAEALEDQWLKSQEGKDIYNKFSVSIDAHILPQNSALNKPTKSKQKTVSFNLVDEVRYIDDHEKKNKSPDNHASNRISATVNPLYSQKFDNDHDDQDDKDVDDNLPNDVDLNNNNVQSAQNSSSSNQSQDKKQRLISLCHAETGPRPLFQHFSTLLSHDKRCSLNERDFIESEIPFKSVKPLLNSNSTVSRVVAKFPSDLLQGNATLLAKAYPTAAGTASNDAPLSQVAVKLVAAKGGVSNITEKEQYVQLDDDSKHQVAMELAILYMNKCYCPGQTITIDKGDDAEKLRVYAAVDALIRVKHTSDRHNVGTINVVIEEAAVANHAKEDAVAGFKKWLGEQGEKYSGYLTQLSQPKQTTADKLKSFLFKAKAPVQPTQNQSVEITAKPWRPWQ